MTETSYPHNVSGEKSLISLALQYPDEHLPEILAEGITAEHFYTPSARIIFEMICRLVDEGKPMEPVVLIDYLNERGLLQRCGGAAAIAEAYTYAPSGLALMHHIERVRASYAMRELMKKAADMSASAQSSDDPWTVLDNAELDVLAIRERVAPEQQLTTKQAVVSVLGDIEDEIRGIEQPDGVKTGFAGIDAMTRGLRPGNLFVIAARPSMGKTALMMNIVEHVALDLEKPVLVFSLEMPTNEIVRRLLVSRSKVGGSSFGSHTSKGELKAVQRASVAISQSSLHFNDKAGISIGEIRAVARRHKRRHGIKMVAIDYAQLAKSGSDQAKFSREREIAEISAGCKAMAKELSLPVILLAQLNRDCEKRGGKGLNKSVPRMSDLRESGALEQDADIVGLLHRPAYYAEDENEREAIGDYARLIIAKNRNGATGDQHLAFIPTLTRFENGTVPDFPEPKQSGGRFGG